MNKIKVLLFWGFQDELAVNKFINTNNKIGDAPTLIAGGFSSW